jgi:hypothetical protein
LDFSAFKDWAFLGLLSCGIVILNSMRISVNALNVKIAVVIEKLNNHEKRLDRLEEVK